MGWSIACVENTLVVPEECGEELRNLVEKTEDGEEYPVELDLYSYSPQLEFNVDHMEHMDCLWREEVQAVLAKHKVSGRVCFGSLEGDNSGDFWGYEWTNGELRMLSGTLHWEVDNG